MAEIRVERKPRRSVWPWILGLVVAALLVWALVATMNNNHRSEARLQQSSLTSMTFAVPTVQPELLARAA
jgi:hypothetical protein